MGTSIVQTDSLLQSRKKRSFSLPSFRRSSAVERQEVAMRREEESAEEAARIQKAAAWQWYTRGVGEAVVPTKRPPPLGISPPCQAPVDDGTSKAFTNNSNIVLQKKPPEQRLLQAESPRAASRFKAEATISAGAQPPSSPLYDEFELSGLRTHMADFVQRLQLPQQTKANELQSPAHKSKPGLQHIAALHDGRSLPATDHQHTSKAAAVISSDHQQLTKPPPPSAAPLASTIPFHMRPFSALHRVFRKVVSGSILKSTKNSPIINSYEPEVLSEEEEEYHYHHYIHHHHHHYHYGQSPEAIIRSGRRRHSESSGIRPSLLKAESHEEEEEFERSSCMEAYHLARMRRRLSEAIIRSGRRRHSESSGIRPHIPSLLEAEYSDEEEEEIERSSIEAYLARRRRHSDSFAGHLTPQKAAFDEEEETKGEPLQLQLPRRYNSERFSPNKIPTIVSEDINEGLPEIRSRRRHSAENQREEESLERKAEGGGKIGGGTYKLSRAADSALAAKALVRRRHSEAGLQRPEMGKRTPSPSARYLQGLLERQIGVAAASSNPQ